MITTNSHVLRLCSVVLALAVALLPAEAETQKDLKMLAQGTASWYGKKFHGRKTASGAIYDMNKLTCAHRTLPFGTKLLVYNASTSQSCVVTVNDRGPFHGRRVLDLSKAAAHKLGITGLGKVVCYQGDYRNTGNAVAALQTITALPNLETTTLPNMEPHALPEASVRKLSDNLTSLAASNALNTDHCLEKIARVPSGSGRITEDSLKILESLEKLKHSDPGHLPIGKGTIDTLAKLNKLERLHSGGCTFTINSIAGLPKSNCLNFVESYTY